MRKVGVEEVFFLSFCKLFMVSGLQKMKLDYYVDFGNVNYSYSEGDKFKDNENFWEYYFEQTPTKTNGNFIKNNKFENYPLKIWAKSCFHELHQVLVSTINFKADIKEAFNNIKERFKKSRILCIHIRKTVPPDRRSEGKADYAGNRNAMECYFLKEPYRNRSTWIAYAHSDRIGCRLYQHRAEA